MAYSGRQYQSERERIMATYGARSVEITLAQKERDAKETEKASKTAVKLKAGETVQDLLQKGFYRKNKQIMDQDYFKGAEFIGEGEDAINMFSTESIKGVPFGDLLGFESVNINPSVYKSLGKSYFEGITPNVDNVMMDPRGVPMQSNYPSEAADMSDKLFAKLGKDVVATGGADEVAEAGTKLAEKLGTWGTVGKYLGPAASALGVVSGINTALTAKEEDERYMGVASAVGSGMVLGGAAATAAGIGVANWWNPVGWGIGIGAGLYGLGKGAGIL